MTVASYGATKISRIFEPAVVRTPLVRMMSLIADRDAVERPERLAVGAPRVGRARLRERQLRR